MAALWLNVPIIIAELGDGSGVSTQSVAGALRDVEGEIDMTERLEEIHSTINQAVYGLLEGHNEDRTAIAEALLGRAIHIIIVASDLNVTDAVAELKKMRAAINEELAPYEAEQAP